MKTFENAACDKNSFQHILSTLQGLQFNAYILLYIYIFANRRFFLLFFKAGHLLAKAFILQNVHYCLKSVPLVIKQYLRGLPHPQEAQESSYKAWFNSLENIKGSL